MLCRHKRIIVILLILITVMPVGTAYADADADGPGSAAFPSIDELFGGQNRSPYLTEYRDNYYLDMVDFNIFTNREGILNDPANVIFKLQYFLGYLLVVVFYYAFEINFYEIFSGFIGTFITEMKTTMFDELSLIAIVLIGLFYVVKIIQDQKTQIWIAIIQTVIIVALATYFFTNPMQMLKQVDIASKELSRSVLIGTYKAGNNGNGSQDSAVIAAANDIWMMFVHRPWQILEFGNISLAEKEEKNILSLSPGSKERKEYIKKLAQDKKHFTPNWGPERLAFIFCYFIPMLVIAVCILVLCLLILAYQFLTILYALMGVFIFVLALIPFFGIRVVESWFSRIIGTAMIKVIVCFCLGLMFAFNSALFKLGNVYNWFLLLILQMVIIGVIIWKKDSIFEAFTTIRLVSQNAAAINKQLRRDVNMEEKIKDYARNVNMRRKHKSGTSYDHYTDGEDTSGTFDAKTYQTASEGARRTSYSAREYTKGGESGSFNQLVQEIHEDTTNDNENFRQFMKKAEEILEKQYELSKEASEEKAQRYNKEPEYTSFVYKVNTREALGAPRFEQREIIAVAMELQRVLKAGGRVEDLYDRDAKAALQQVERPASVIDIIINGQKTSIDQNEADKIEINDIAQDYVQEFNRDYSKNYDKKFMEGLIKKYGREQVREILDKMKDIQKKERNIKNPAGYLTQSLKNNAAQENMRNKAMDRTV